MKNFVIIFSVLILFGCGGTNDSSVSHSQSQSDALSCRNAPLGGSYALANPSTGTNVLPVVLNGTYANAPTVTIKICEPGTATCTSIDNILVDTGSYGLRVFGSTLASLSLPQINSPSSHPLAECALFGIGSTWGPIKSAGVVLGGESAVTIPIQVIDASFGTRPSGCADADVSPTDAGYNGILGVGLFQEDCGIFCTTANPALDLYYSCNGNVCTASNASLSSQVVNPIVKLATNNNGVILELPAIPICGVELVTGTLTLGIGTAANNIPGVAKTFLADANGEFTTIFNGHTYTQSFIDSGSNAFFFPSTSSLPACASINGNDISTFVCPNETLNFSAVQKSGSTQQTVNFQISNARNLFLSNNYNYVDIAVNWAGAFDWGLPFFYGRKVFVGVEAKTSTLGTGPYWAY